ncbi:MAG: agmatine deiminase family protein [Ignavibacteriaceae bacterium]|nr:agmatine deiminase family protein [Ignavibacteriaceae bacterium]
MKAKFSLLIILILFIPNLYSQNLPHYLTDHEKELLKTYTPPAINVDYITPPVRNVRTMAEWEELEGIIITWTSYTSILRQIVDYAQEEGKVFIVCSDSNSVKSYLTSGGVPLTNVNFLITGYNSIWVRDYGPWTVYADDVDSLYIVDWVYNRPRPADDVVPVYFANYYNAPIYQTTSSPYNLVNTGGNFMVDGMGTAFASKLVLTENSTKTEAEIDTIIKKFMGINRFIKMNTLPYDEIHHIDMHMKLLDEETLLVGQYPTGISDGPQIEANLNYVLTNFMNSFGRPYKVVRVQMPPDATGRYPSGGGQYRTFTNSVIVNKTVIVPTYDVQYDTTALRIYREAMPGYNVVGINCNGIIGALGAIHCITKEVGIKNPIYISHKPNLTSVQNEFGIEISAKVKSMLNITQVNLFWKIDGEQLYNQVVMQSNGNSEYIGYISAQPVGTKIKYYISASSTSGKTISKPMTAPNGNYTTVADYQVPVEMVNLRMFNHGNKVTINWQTVTETNNNGFEVQRMKKDGKNEDWEVISFIKGRGNSLDNTSYEYVDLIKTSGRYEYRLKQIDFSGEFTYFEIAEIDVHPFTFELLQNYPNPFNPRTTISFQLAAEGQTSLKLYDMLGNEVVTIFDEVKKDGIHSIEFDASSLSSGIYFYTLRANDLFKTKKMILIK